MSRRMHRHIALVSVGFAVVFGACSSDSTKDASPTTGSSGDTRACRSVGTSISPTDAPAGAPQGTKAYTGMSQNHVKGCVNYPQTPPVGGDHNQVWQSCGVYPKAVPIESAVHSMEHGGVWITYSPSLDTNQIAKLGKFASNEFVLVSPWKTALPTAISVQAWGLQLQLDSATDPRLTAFVEAFANGPQNPEAGVPCRGGGTMTE